MRGKLTEIVISFLIVFITAETFSGCGGCGKESSRKNSTEKRFITPEIKKTAAEGQKVLNSSTGQEALADKKTPEEIQKKAKENLPDYKSTNEAQKLVTTTAPSQYSNNLPDLSGFSGMDPDSFPPGEAGLDAIVEMLAEVGDEATDKAAKQMSQFEGKKLATPEELSKGLPEEIAGWEKIGKTELTREKQKNSVLPIASSKFWRKDGVIANIAIMDTMQAGEVRVGYEMGLAIAKKVHSPRQKEVTIGNHKGFILVREKNGYSGKNAQSKGALLVSGRFLIVLTIDGLADFEEAFRFLSSSKIINIEEIAK